MKPKIIKYQLSPEEYSNGFSTLLSKIIVENEPLQDSMPNEITIIVTIYPPFQVDEGWINQIKIPIIYRKDKKRVPKEIKVRINKREIISGQS